LNFLQIFVKLCSFRATSLNFLQILWAAARLGNDVHFANRNGLGESCRNCEPPRFGEIAVHRCVLGNLGEFRGIYGNFGEFRGIYGNFGEFTATFGNFGEFTATFGKIVANRCKSLQKVPNRCKSLQIVANRCVCLKLPVFLQSQTVCSVRLASLFQVNMEARGCPNKQPG
jgi:hypothetical protein